MGGRLRILLTERNLMWIERGLRCHNVAGGSALKVGSRYCRQNMNGDRSPRNEYSGTENREVSL